MAPNIDTNASVPASSGSQNTITEQNPWSVDSVISKLAHKPQAKSSSPLPFFHMLELLKTTKREGWRRFEIQHGESISDHMYRMSIMTMLAPQSLTKRLDVSRCTRMALVHDMAEALVGDITPVDGIPKPEKSRRESETMDYFCITLLGNVQGGSAGQEIRALWQEYEDDKTEEAHFVHDIDKMELLLQMIEYERTHNNGTGNSINLGEFIYVAERIKLPEVQEWAEEIKHERLEFWAALGHNPRDHISKTLESQQDEYYGN
ncbi:MAG: hypothetical protein M1834_000057 [Cirrosporium novae-zelandiae]|nr:MAG: hypothetical protein M1834_000057 [Cirrosporium novae-zelandiae]